MTEGPRHVVVVGGGITGLAAAWEAVRRGARVTVLEADDRLGGRIRTTEVAGRPVDVGADAFLARRPEGLDLARELGIGDRLVHPAASGVWLWARGALRPMPDGTLMGAPSDPVALARSGVLPPAALARAVLEPVRARLRGVPDVGGPSVADDEPSVAAAIAAAFGPAVVDQLVEPLLGGIYAGRADDLGLWSAAPALAAPFADAGAHGSVTAALAERRRRGATVTTPVFATFADGLGALVDVLAQRLRERGVRLRLGVTATGIERAADGWEVGVGPAPVPATDEPALATTVAADAVVVAVPAGAAADLLRPVVPAAAQRLGAIRYASVATVSLAYTPEAVARVPVGSGVLVPRNAGLLTKAATWGWQKWAHQASGDLRFVRCSVGRVDDDRALRHDDAELARRVDAELRAMTGVDAPAVERQVTRWPSSLPQYRPGHRRLVAEVHAAVSAHAGLAVAGAALDGVGVAPCIAQGRAAAVRALDA